MKIWGWNFQTEDNGDYKALRWMDGFFLGGFSVGRKSGLAGML